MKKSKQALFLLSCASDLMDDYLALMRAIKTDGAYIEDAVNLQTEIDYFVSNYSKPDDVLCCIEKYWPESERLKYDR